MQFDLITIFPQYFDVLQLSLVGKAQETGKIHAQVHNLRQWAEGRHQSVDDSPAGGGPGMVMRPDVWGRAVDSVLGGEPANTVLAIPTPAGKPLNQRMLEELSKAERIVVLCGRYEGIDSRIAAHYAAQEGVEVLEYSLGDYVLNGGEIAALALVEGVARLVEGVVGNPESVVEESHSEAGLLEGDVYTSPRTWRSLGTPPVLVSGDHARIQRWRRDSALRRTLRTRPDMIAALLSEEGALNSRDREVLAGEGLLPTNPPVPVAFRPVEQDEEDLQLVSRLATRTFPLACPPGTSGEEIDAFTSENLTAQALRAEMGKGARLGVAEVGGEAIAYTLLLPEHPEGALGEGRTLEDCAYVSKCYADANWQGSGVAGALLEWSLEDAVQAWGSKWSALGTNKGNRRAARFYRRHGYSKDGSRTFEVGGRQHADDVFVRDLTRDPPA